MAGPDRRSAQSFPSQFALDGGRHPEVGIDARSTLGVEAGSSLMP